MFTRILAKTGILTTLCMYPSVEVLSEMRYLNRSSHSLSLPARALVCAAAEERRRRELESCAMAGVDCR